MTAAPHSPLNLRLVLALLGTLFCLGFGVLTLRAFGVGPSLFLFALALVGVVDLVVIQRRRAERARADARTGQQHDSLFE
jgi:hypothetical protein